MKTAVQLLQQQQQNIHQQQQQRKSIANNNFMLTGSSVSPTNSAANNVSHFKLNSSNLMRSPETVAHSSSPTPIANKVKCLSATAAKHFASTDVFSKLFSSAAFLILFTLFDYLLQLIWANNLYLSLTCSNLKRFLFIRIRNNFNISKLLKRKLATQNTAHLYNDLHMFAAKRLIFSSFFSLAE